MFENLQNPKQKVYAFINRYGLLGLFVILKMLLQYWVVNPVYELQRDEFLHLNQAHHLAFGFISVPPLTSLFSVMIYALGGSLFWIRFVPALFGAITMIFSWRIVEELQGKMFSKIMVSTALLCSVYVRINILYQPNSFDILAWTMVYYFLVRYLKSEQKRWLFYIGITAVAGFYNKYNISFLIIGLVISLFFSEHRKIMWTANFWKVVGLSFLILLPNLIWQISYHFPFLMHMKALQQYQLVNNSAIGFLKSQVLIIFGSLPVIIASLIGFSIYRPFKKYRTIGISFVLILFIFSTLKAKDYYALGLYPVLLAFGSVYLENIWKDGWLKFLRPVPVLFNLSLFFWVAPYIFPLWSPEQIIKNREGFERIGMLRWEDGKNHALPQDFSDMLGWKEMAAKTLKVYEGIPQKDRKNTLIFCDNYGECGALNYYNHGKTPEAYAFNTDHIYWLPTMDTIQHIILVGEKPDSSVLRWFTACRYNGQIESFYSREKGTPIYLLYNSKNGFTEMFYKMAEERKRKFDIF